MMARRDMAERPVCDTCGLQLWKHRRCVVCTRFVWCTDKTTSTSGVIHRGGCARVTGGEDKP